MKKLAIAVILCIPMLVQAAGDVQAGKEKSTVCAACHGETGVSVNPIWPNLAGQHSPYLIDQLKSFKSGKRNNPSMTSLVANLSEQDMADLAAYYSSQPIPEGRTAKKYLERGQQIYRGGDIQKHITACIACHGPHGTGNGQAGFPELSGQHATYTLSQLQAYKSKERSTDINHIMQDISSNMSQDDMEAVANYVQGLH